MPRTHPLLAALVTTSVVLTCALGWFGWRLIVQQRDIDARRVETQTEAAADAMVSAFRGRLAEVGETLSAALSDPGGALSARADMVVVTRFAGTVSVAPAGALPFVPVAPRTVPERPVFADADTRERAGDLDGAAEAYRALVRAPDVVTRAGALIRLGRVLRQRGAHHQALPVYEQLARVGDVASDGLPAGLVGLDMQRDTHRALGDAQAERRVAAGVIDAIDAGRWRMGRGTAEFYRDRAVESLEAGAAGRAGRPAAWTLAEAVAEVWPDVVASATGRGQRALRLADHGVIVLWRTRASNVALAVAMAHPFFARLAQDELAWLLLDANQQPIAGVGESEGASVERVVGAPDSAWTLRAQLAPSVTLPPSGRTGLLVMMAAVFVFIWAATYFMARAIRREAVVARLQSDFVAAVSHEFRSPLTTVRQMAEMLEMGRLSSESRRQQYYHGIAAEASRLQRLIETLLTFGRTEAGAGQHTPAPVTLATVVEAAVGDVEPQARERGTRIACTNSPGDVVVHADADALRVALRNLIENAVTYSPAGSTVTLRWRRERDGVAVDVIDRGFGIEPAERQQIFRKFVRGRAAREARARGTGVGLAIVQHIVAAHGGSIEVESDVGRGSTFTVWLPLAASDVTAAEPVAAMSDVAVTSKP